MYVAWGKHANYISDSECDSGGPTILGFPSHSDECFSNYYQRDYYSAYRNLGSSTHNRLDCVESEGLYAGSGRSECFWATAGNFEEWTGLHWTDNVAQYGVMLQDRGF